MLYFKSPNPSGRAAEVIKPTDQRRDKRVAPREGVTSGVRGGAGGGG